MNRPHRDPWSAPSMPDESPRPTPGAALARTWELPVLAVTCALLWGSAFPTIKFVYGAWDGAGTLPVRLAFAGVRFMLAGLLLMPLRGNPWRSVTRETWRPLAALALTQTVLQYLFFYNGLAVSGGILGSLLVASGSFWWVLVAPLFLRTNPPTRRQWLGLAACALGITLAVWRPGAGAGDPVTGGLLFLAASLSGALGAVAVARMSGRVRPTHATSLSLFTGGAVLALLGMPGWTSFVGLLEPRIAGMTLYLAFVSATAFALWNHLVQCHPANVLAGYRFLIPLAGVVESALLIPGESLGWGALAGGAAIITALAVVNRPTQPDSPEKTAPSTTHPGDRT